MSATRRRSERFSSSRSTDTRGFHATDVTQDVLREGILEKAVVILDKSKAEFLLAVRDGVQAYVRSQDTRTCLSLVEMQMVQSTSGLIIEREVGRYPFSPWLPAFGVRFAAFVSAQNGVSPQYQGNIIDSSLSRPIRDQVLSHFKELYTRNTEQIAGCFVDQLIQDASNQDDLVRRAKYRIRHTNPRLSRDERAFLEALDDHSIIKFLVQGSSDDTYKTEGIQGQLGLTTIQPSLELLKSLDQLIKISFEKRTVENPAYDVIGPIILMFVSTAIISMTITLLGAMGLAATTWYLMVPVIASLIGGAYKWVHFPEDLAINVSTSLHDQLDQNFQDYNRQIVQAIFKNIVVSNMDEVLALIINKNTMTALTNEFASIDYALAVKNLALLEVLLTTRFSDVTRGEMEWIGDLESMGLSARDISQLLLQDKHDAPWIFFEAFQLDHANLVGDYHVPGCVHQLLEADPWLKAQFQSSSEYYLDQSTRRELERVCGIAGVSPISRNRDTWNGSVRFDKANNLAVVSYGRAENGVVIEPKVVLQRTSVVLKNLCRAFAHGQNERLCCDSFTILRLPETHYNESSGPSAIHMCRVDIKLVLRLLEALESYIARPFLKAAHLKQSITDIFQIFSDSNAIFLDMNDTPRILSCCCLAAQFLSLGFLSYIQAHIGVIEPSFLDIPLETIHLLGAEQSRNQETHIHVSLKHLTCVGEMLRERVVTFQLVNSSSLGLTSSSSKFDLFANAEDLAETWGPAEFLFRQDGKLPFAMGIRGGFIHATNESLTRYHWGMNHNAVGRFQGDAELTKKFLIGSAAFIKNDCQRDSNLCWEASSGRMVELGTEPSRWEANQYQFGFQAGLYYTLRVNKTYARNPGTTLKHRRLSEDIRSNDGLLQFLNYLSGLQVSFCTGVCRRVTLREVIADLLPQFMRNWLPNPTSLEKEALNQLISTKKVADLLRNHTDLQWFWDLDNNQLQDYLIELIRLILNILKPTGFDDAGKKLRIAWPNQKQYSRCFEVDCRGQSSWAPFLADSKDCATFAYITTLCLETNTDACRGSDAEWPCIIPALETNVICTEGPTELSHGSSFYLEKMARPLYVRVYRPNKSSIAELKILKIFNSFPLRIEKRLLSGEWGLKKLREKRSCVEDDSSQGVMVRADSKRDNSY